MRGFRTRRQPCLENPGTKTGQILLKKLITTDTDGESTAGSMLLRLIHSDFDFSWECISSALDLEDRTRNE